MTQHIHIKSLVFNPLKVFYLMGWLVFALPLMVSAQDSTNVINQTDTISAPTQDDTYKSGREPVFNPQDRHGNSILYGTPSSPFLLKDPMQLEIEVDTGRNYTIREKYGDLNYRAPSNLTFEQYNKLFDQRMKKQYFKDMSSGLDGESAVSGRRLIPPIYMSPVFDRIFGGSFVDIRPNGFITLDFGGRWQRLKNPSIPIRQQKSGGFEFDEQISMNVVGKIGEKLSITADFDNNNSFDFENNLKVEYTGFEEDIIQKIEIGNVSLPVSNSLITGAQNLFGIKTMLRFGKLDVTGVMSTQRGKSDQIEINGGMDGGQGREFEVRVSDYEDNRHFFLGHFFRKNYESWLRGIPQVISGVDVGRVEVYIINRQNNTETLRNFLAFMDLGEGETIYQSGNPQVGPGNGGPNRNDANLLYNSLTSNPGIRNKNDGPGILEGSFNFVKATDYESITAARKLDEREYTVNRQLGYISLVRKLQSDEVLAVAYEYTYNGQPYKVGELTEDYNSLPENESIILKLIRPSKIDTEVPTWDLMMKNIYSLNATQITPEGFQLRIVYRDDKTGVDNPSIHEGAKTKNVPLVQLLGLDRLNSSNDPQPDGNFDFVTGITVLPETGQIIFPNLEPFGQKLKSYFDPDTEGGLINKYVYDNLYSTTKSDAELDVTKNKFYLEGRMQAGSSSEIMLPGINISEGSVVVMAGGLPLVEGQDYRVDYNLGRVTIINEAVLNSGKAINITYEKADMFNFQARSLLGTRLDYHLNDDVNFGATLLYHNERPLYSRVSIGSEPIRNLKYGFDVNLRKDSRFLTKMVDALPLIQTKEPSTINFNAEFAQILPGTSNIVNGDETSYIDDFEASATPFNLGNGILNWKLAHTPVTDDHRFFPDATSINNDLALGYKRAKASWYVIDNIFYRSSGVSRPDNITDEDMVNNYVRAIPPREIFQKQDRQVINTNLSIFDFAYYPSERGPFNYNPDLNSNNLLDNPRSNWGGITRAITSDVDFDKNNIEYIEFWMMDPFIPGSNGVVRDGIFNTNNTTGGKLVFNLGSISEDVIKDNSHGFENGLPADGDNGVLDTTAWGYVTRQQFLTNSFDNSESSRQNQDLGLDGVRNSEEATFFQDYINSVPPEVRDQILEDVSGDNFKYYLGSEYDENDVKVLERYKNYNGTENNSPIISNLNSSFTPSGSSTPDNEDLNSDNTISDLEEYYEYELDLRPGQLAIGNNYIVDRVTNNINGDNVDWYLFRIPIRKPTGTHGNISGYKSIRFIRMYCTDFQQPVVMRMAKFQFVGSQWRKYDGNLYQRGLNEIPEPVDDNFLVSEVNIEENGTTSGDKIPYVLPPGINRDQDNTSPTNRLQNEKSLKISVENLEDGDARAVYKNFVTDLINYGRIKMFLHAEKFSSEHDLQDDEVTAFLRLGTDFIDNYYEIELPLKITPEGSTGQREIWPEENEINLAFNELYRLKSRRNQMGIDIDLPYSEAFEKYLLTVSGNPDLQSVQTIMIGIRNPETDDETPHSVVVWANELRVTDFDRTAGWAANAYLNAKLADLMTVTASTRYTSFGFGGVQQRIAERTRKETFQYDVSANIALDKFLPEKTGIKIPMFMSYENSKITPKYDPKNPDIPLEATLSAFDSERDAKDYKKIVQERAERKSINFVNVRKEKTKPDAKSHIYDIENVSVTYAYSETNRSDFNTESYRLQEQRGSLAYNYSPKGGIIEPFKNSKALDGKYLKLIKDFNLSLLPSDLSFRTDLNRRFIKTQLRNADLTTTGILPTYEKYFTFNRFYNLRWAISKGLSFDYNARANTIIDEPYGELDTPEKRQTVWENLKKMGRMKTFDQNFNINYKVPLDKIPLVDWISSDVRYGVGYIWTAGAYSDIDSLNVQKILGNTIQNNREIGLNGKIDLVKLYNKSKFLREINTPPRRSARSRARPNTAQDTTKTKKSEMKVAKGLTRLLMSVRSFTVTYNTRQSTMLPGFNRSPFLLGQDTSWASPGWSFLFGSQNPEYRYEAARKGWIMQDTLFSTPFTQAKTYDLNLKASIEPAKSFRIQLDAKKSATGNFLELFRVNQNVNTNEFEYNGVNTSRSGSYSISINSMKTSFIKDDDNNNSPVFNTFEENLDIIRNRLQTENVNEGQYSRKSQDVMIPAFIAAYTGKDPNKVALNPFPKIPIPGWRVDFSGLGEIKALKKNFSSINLTHSYSSTYTINNYSNSLKYQDNLELDALLNYYPMPSDTNEVGEFVSPFLMSQVVIQERYGPLFGINIRTKSRMTFRLDFKKERNLALNMSNSQITELKSSDISLDFGFTKADLKLPFKSQGRVIALKNDVTFKLNLTIRDTKTIQRKIDDVNTITAGNMNFQLKPQVSYVLNDRLNLNIYFERNVNMPQVTTSYPRSTSQFGIQARFSLAQ